MANQHADTPLEGSGIVWIDEIELHMHPCWQRMVLPVLRKTFPNIQFIVTTHSLQALGKVDNGYNVYMPMNEEYMETGSFNPAF
nr:AAA family ATPase [Agathobaculum desmolans]